MVLHSLHTLCILSARALHHILEYKNHGVKWPHQTLSIDQLLSTIIKRLNEASGIYQMFSVLCDVVLIKESVYSLCAQGSS